MSSTYNSRLLVPEVLVSGGRFAVIRARPSYEAMLGLGHRPRLARRSAEPAQHRRRRDARCRMTDHARRRSACSPRGCGWRAPRCSGNGCGRRLAGVVRRSASLPSWRCSICCRYCRRAAHAGVLALFAIAFAGGGRVGLARGRDRRLAGPRSRRAAASKRRAACRIARCRRSPIARARRSTRRRARCGRRISAAMAAAVRRLRVGWPAARRWRGATRGGCARCWRSCCCSARSTPAPIGATGVARAFTPSFAGGARRRSRRASICGSRRPNTPGCRRNSCGPATASAVAGPDRQRAARPGAWRRRRAAPGDRRGRRAISRRSTSRISASSATLTGGNAADPEPGRQRCSAAGRSRSFPTTRRRSPSPSRPTATPRAALRLDYRAGDDYGVESVKAVIRRPARNARRGARGRDRARAAAAGAAPQGSRGDELSRSVAASLGRPAGRDPAGRDRCARPDRRERAGADGPARARAFTNPVARAIIDQRKELVKDPGLAPTRSPRSSAI